MSTVGIPPIGIVPIATEHASTLAIESLDVKYEIDTFVVGGPGDLFIEEDVEYSFESPGLSIAQKITITIDELDYGFYDDDVGVTQTQSLAFNDVIFKLEIPDLLSVQPQILIIPDISYRFDIPLILIDQEIGLTIPSVDYRIDIPGVSIQSPRNLVIDSNDLTFSIPEIWVFFPQGCVGLSSTRVIDGGLLIDRDPDGSESTDRWYTEDRYRFKIKWDHISAQVAKAIDGFFRSYRYQETSYKWAGDGQYYIVMLSNDVNIHQNGADDDWQATIEFIGSKLTPKNSVLSRFNYTKVGDAEALRYAQLTGTRILNIPN